MPPARSDLLAAVLTTLLPAEPPFPAGACVTATVAIDLGEAIGLLNALPADFASGDEAALRVLEAAQPEAFDHLVRACYLAYYTDPVVRHALELATGYPARPPQPLGYKLPPFDDALLERQRRARPIWRDAG